MRLHGFSHVSRLSRADGRQILLTDHDTLTDQTNLHHLIKDLEERHRQRTIAEARKKLREGEQYNNPEALSDVCLERLFWPEECLRTPAADQPHLKHFDRESISFQQFFVKRTDPPAAQPGWAAAATGSIAPGLSFTDANSNGRRHPLSFGRPSHG